MPQASSWFDTWKSYFSSLFQKIFGQKLKDKKICLIGLDGAGKTTVLSYFRFNEAPGATVPTIGFNVETLEIGGCSICVWDIGGQDKIRKLWHHYYENTNGVIFVVDSLDRDRMGEARDELRKVMEHDAMVGVPVLVYANKQDLPGAMGAQQMEKELDLSTICKSASNNHSFMVWACTAVNGQGLYEGIDWLADQMNRKERA
jgi:ADP-ribosylation factor protein 1